MCSFWKGIPVTFLFVLIAACCPGAGAKKTYPRGESWNPRNSYSVPVQHEVRDANGRVRSREGVRTLKDGTRIHIKETYRERTPEEKAKSKAWHKKVRERREKERAEWRERIRKEREPEERREAARKARAAMEAARLRRHAAISALEKKGFLEVNKARSVKNFVQVVAVLKRMSAKGSPNAPCMLAKMYYEGDGVKADKKEAVKWYYKAAANGSSKGIYTLARMYLEGDGLDKDLKQSVKWLKLCHEPDAGYLLGSMYMEGVGVEKDFGRAAACFKKSGNPMANAGLGEICFLGLGTPKRTAEAKRLFEKAATSGNAKALFYLSKMYATGDGVPEDSERAARYLSRYKASAAKIGKPATVEDELGLKGLSSMEERMGRLVSENAALAARRKERLTAAQKKHDAALKKAALKKKRIAKKPVQPEAVDKPALPKKSRSQVYLEVEELVKRFYPKAKISQSENNIHFEFKTREYKGIGGRVVTVPKLDGIVGDITLESGRYPGKEYLPQQTNGTLYVSLLMAPYSESFNNHLLTKLKFPPNAPLDFVSQFKELVSMYSN